MCAFGIIIGDTLPQVLRSTFPKLPTIPILKIFANRQFLIALCTIGVSYPLSLYRDIHKLARASALALVGVVIIVASVLVEGPHVPPELKGRQDGKFSIIAPGVFQAIGVISFAFGGFASIVYTSSHISSNFNSLSSQFPLNLWQSSYANTGQIRKSDPCVNISISRVLYNAGRLSISCLHG